MITDAGWSLLTGPGVRFMFHETMFGDVEHGEDAVLRRR
jgi:hypothetical protein